MQSHIQPANRDQACWNSLLRLAHSGFEDGALRDHPGFQITPEGDCQFARQGNDHDAPDTPLLTLGAMMEPLAQRTIRLMYPLPGAKPRTVMSSIIRWRSRLVAVLVMINSCL